MDGLIQNLLDAKEQLRLRVVHLYGELKRAQDDMKSLDLLLERQGYHASGEDHASQEQEKGPDDIAADEAFAEAVRTAIENYGFVETAIRAVKFILRNHAPGRTAGVKALYAAFPEPLKAAYNPDPAVAAEALRSQIRARIEKGDPELGYDGGTVYLKEKEADETTSSS